MKRCTIDTDLLPSQWVLEGKFVQPKISFPNYGKLAREFGACPKCRRGIILETAVTLWCDRRYKTRDACPFEMRKPPKPSVRAIQRALRDARKAFKAFT